MALPATALPGQLLGHADQYLPGPGTHLHDSQIYASISGLVLASPQARSSSSSSSSSSSKPLSTLSISRDACAQSQSHSHSQSPTLLPTISSLVLCRITRLTPRAATCTLLALAGPTPTSTPTFTPLPTPLPGQIRREDVRATEKDKTRIERSFRVGDIVRAQVISLGDQQSGYFVATDRNELGVVVARREGGGGGGGGEGRVMVPVSWCEVMDPVSGVREERKVAKPF